MRYANGLLKEGRKLLHWLTHIFVRGFIVNFLLIWPVKYIWRGENYQDSVKGKLCMKANFTSKFGTDVELSLKPILILISHTTMANEFGSKIFRCFFGPPESSQSLSSSSIFFPLLSGFCRVVKHICGLI